MRRVVISTSRHPNYDFFAPISCLMWNQVHYAPLLLLTHDEEHWNNSVSYDALKRLNVRMEFIGKVDGCSTILAAKLSRYSACALDLPEDDYLLTSDVDIWPLDREWFNQQDESKAMTFWYANSHDYEMHATCYIGATVNKWREFWSDPEASIQAHIELGVKLKSRSHKSDWTGWKSDEEFMKDYWSFWMSRVDPGPRDTQMIEGSYADLRIDRSNWPRPLNLEGKVDAHLPRPGYNSRVWKLIAPILEVKIPQHMDWINGYRERYLKGL